MFLNHCRQLEKGSWTIVWRWIVNNAAHSSQVIQFEQSYAKINCGTLNPITKQPLVLPNTSQQEVPSQTHEFSNSLPTKEVGISRLKEENQQDFQGPSQRTLSMLSIDAKNSTSMEMSQEQSGELNNDLVQVIDEVSPKSKTWAEQVEDEKYQNKGSGRENLQENLLTNFGQ